MNDSASPSSSSASPSGWTERVWRLMSSMRTTAILATLLAVLIGGASLIPQGREAMALLLFEHTETLRTLHVWGLTNIFESVWVQILGVFLFTNILSVLIRLWGSRKGLGADAVRMPTKAPHASELTATLPERSVEMMRESFRASLGSSPLSEKVDGSRVTMVFDSSPNADLAPLLTHVGLILLVAGAGLASIPAPLNHSVVRAILKVTNSQTGYTGTFDMAQDEPIQFFQFRPNFTIRSYTASRNGLGPAIRIEQSLPNTQQRSEFWVYQYAPPGFDAKHRQGIVFIEPVRFGLEPAPGHGLASRPTAVLMVLGLAILVLGALASSRSAGRIWVDIDGDRVKLVGVPNRAGDQGFARFFLRLEILARAVLAE